MAAPDAPFSQSSESTQPVTNGYAPHKHGNIAQWAAVIVSVVALVGLFVNIALTLYFHYSAAQSQTSDEHVASIVNDSLDKKLPALSSQIAEENTRISKLEGRFEQLDAEQKKMRAALVDKIGKDGIEEASLGPTTNTKLLRIQLTLQAAQDQKKILSASDLYGFRAAILRSSADYQEYWSTVAAIINYQSFLNQINNEAPDPLKVSRPCVGVTRGNGIFSEGNSYFGNTLSNCLVDLDTERFENVTFQNSVIRYSGGKTTLIGVRFVNCRFLLNVAAQAQPKSPDFMRTLLASETLRNVLVGNPG